MMLKNLFFALLFLLSVSGKGHWLIYTLQDQTNVTIGRTDLYVTCYDVQGSLPVVGVRTNGSVSAGTLYDMPGCVGYRLEMRWMTPDYYSFPEPLQAKSILF
jgi:hypothetical protein